MSEGALGGAPTGLVESGAVWTFLHAGEWLHGHQETLSTQGVAVPWSVPLPDRFGSLHLGQTAAPKKICGRYHLPVWPEQRCARRHLR